MGGWCAAFPGREAAEKGMSSSFYTGNSLVRHIFYQASRYCHENIARLCYEETIDPKWQTICLVTHCYAVFQVVREKYGEPDCTAGYSQGEFTACAAAGVFGFPEVLGLIKNLEEILFLRSHQDEAMYRLVDFTAADLEEICRQVDITGREVSISAYISENQNIISGYKNSILKAVYLAKQKGARWAIDLQADTAYHCMLCDDAAEKSGKYFELYEANDAAFPVYSCYDGGKAVYGPEIKHKLSKQLNHSIKWGQAVKDMADSGIDALVEIGPGCTVSANTRIADGRIQCKWVGSMGEL